MTFISPFLTRKNSQEREINWASLSRDPQRPLLPLQPPPNEVWKIVLGPQLGLQLRPAKKNIKFPFNIRVLVIYYHLASSESGTFVLPLFFWGTFSLPLSSNFLWSIPEKNWGRTLARMWRKESWSRELLSSYSHLSKKAIMCTMSSRKPTTA